MARYDVDFGTNSASSPASVSFHDDVSVTVHGCRNNWKMAPQKCSSEADVTLLTEASQRSERVICEDHGRRCTKQLIWSTDYISSRSYKFEVRSGLELHGNSGIGERRGRWLPKAA